MTLAIKLVREVTSANPCINFRIHMSIRLALIMLTNWMTDRQTNGTDSITLILTADVGGKNPENYPENSEYSSRI